MNIKHILCPVDFSEFNDAANELASSLAETNGAQITYLLILQPDVSFGAAAYLDMDAEAKKEMKLLKAIQPTVDGVSALHVIEIGSPATKIVEYANENNVDMIVVGTHGRTGLKRVLMGSVAEAVVRNADCPVLAIKGRAKVAEAS